MPFVCDFELMAQEEALRKALTNLLKTKFGEPGLDFAKELEESLDPEKLLELITHAGTATKLQHLRKHLAEEPSERPFVSDLELMIEEKMSQKISQETLHNTLNRVLKAKFGEPGSVFAKELEPCRGKSAT